MVALSISLSACTPWHAMAIYSLPSRFKLEPEPDRYFRLSMDVILSGQTHTIDYVWNCTHEKVFSEEGGWILRWRSAHKYAVQTISKDLVVFFQQPSSNYCLVEGKRPYVSDIGVIPDPAVLNNLIVYHVSYYPRSGAILHGTIERLDGNPKVPPPSQLELSLGEGILGLEQYFVAKFVTITPESIWSRYPEMKSYFGAITTVTVAPPPLPSVWTVGFPIWRVRWFSPEDLDKRMYYSVKEINGEIRFDPSMAPEHRETFVLDYNDFRRPVKFCYLERCLSLNGNFNEIYDPETRNIIGVFPSKEFRKHFQ